MKHLCFETRTAVLFAVILCLSPVANAQRQLEKLDRGVVAVRSSSSQVYVGWRLLGTDPDDIGFNLYRVTGSVTNKLNGSLLTATTDFVDATANLTQANSYFVEPVVEGIAQPASGSFTLPANAPTRQYLNIPLSPPPDGVAYDGVPYTYNANDCSAGDVDGDGEYEIILKWDPSNSKDNSQGGFTGNVYIDAYKLDGTRLWRIDLGRNIRAGAHYTQFMVYDLDGDGRAELACKTAPGTVDGLGNDVILPGDDPNADYRDLTPNPVSGRVGYVLSGPEYFTIFDGLTGGELATTSYVVPRGDVCAWGDPNCYGNRVDRFLACVAYLDGKRPSVVMCRGYYTRAVLAAWDWRGGVLSNRWTFDTGFSGGPWSGYKGQGAHSLTVGDVDGDGKDEIVYGACSIDDNGNGLYTTLLGHGDALHLSDMDPDRSGLEVWMVHESPSSYGPNGLEFRDAKDGSLIFGVDGQGDDVGRGVAIDIDPRYRGYEMWGSRGGLMSATGVQISSTKPSQQNFAIHWDSDVLREILDGTQIRKWNWNSGSSSAILSPGGISSNNGTKSTPALSADLFGDWREEVMWRTSDNQNLRIYTTTIPATNRIYTLMHDPQYRCAIAWQNTGYNQPPHPGFNIGPDMARPPLSPISEADLVWRGGSGSVWDSTTTSNWLVNGVWTNAIAAAFEDGQDVLFDISGSNNIPVNLTGALSPSKVTVFSPTDYTFAGGGSLAGSMKFVKAGQGKLTINNNNGYTGDTFVSGGTLFVNGALDGSRVTVEHRGTPEGPSQFGGSGRLGQGLTVEAGCGLTVGAGTNSPGTMTVSNSLVELGGVLNRFDLSGDPDGGVETNDTIKIVGNLSFSGSNTIEINQLDSSLGGGVYTLFEYSGSLTGSIANLELSGDFIQPVMLTNPPGVVGLLVIVPGGPPDPPDGLAASSVGAFQINLNWSDNSADETAFLIERSANDTNNFLQIATVASDTTSYADLGLLPSTTYFYRVRGTNLAGISAYSSLANATTAMTSANLTWRGDGLNNFWDVAGTPNWVDGANAAFFTDGTEVTFDQTGSNNVPVALAGTLKPASVIVNAGKDYTFSGIGALAGTASLVKSGSGTLTFTGTGDNSFSGVVTISGGVVALGTDSGNNQNDSSLGTGPITVAGGAQLRLGGNSGGTQVQHYIPNAITLDNATIFSVDGDQHLTGSTINVGAAGATFLTRWRNKDLLVDGKLTGSGPLTVNYGGGASSGNDKGWVYFNNAQNTYSGTITVLGTTVAVGNRSALANAELNVQGTDANLAWSGITDLVLGGLSGSGNIDLGGNQLEAGNNGSSLTYSGVLSGDGLVTKVGTGKWTLTGDNTYTGTTTVSAGTLLVNGDQSAASGNVTVGAAGTLGGNGTIGGNTTVNGTLAPGTSIGALTFDGDLTLSGSGNASFEISKSPFTNDVVRVQGDVSYGGTLTIVNTSVEMLEAGDNFRLFDAAAYSGAFGNLNLPTLDEGLDWSTNNLSLDGRLWVVSTNPPVLANLQASSGDFTFNGGGGTPGWPYYVLASTNLMLPPGEWERMATNTFDGNGNFSFTNNIDPAKPQTYYRLQLQ